MGKGLFLLFFLHIHAPFLAFGSIFPLLLRLNWLTARSAFFYRLCTAFLAKLYSYKCGKGED